MKRQKQQVRQYLKEHFVVPRNIVALRGGEEVMPIEFEIGGSVCRHRQENCQGDFVVTDGAKRFLSLPERVIDGGGIGEEPEHLYCPVTGYWVRISGATYVIIGECLWYGRGFTVRPLKVIMAFAADEDAVIAALDEQNLRRAAAREFRLPLE